MECRFYVLYILCNDPFRESTFKMVVSINNAGRNGHGLKMTSHRQMASDTFILKFSPVSEFCRHNSDNQKIRTRSLHALNLNF